MSTRPLKAPIAILGMMASICDRVGQFFARTRAVDALVQSEERFRNVFGAAPIGMAVVAPDGRLLQVNDALCEMLGYTEAEMVGMPVEVVIHPDDLDATVQNVSRLLSGEIACFEMEKRYRHKQGHLVWVLLSSSVARDAEGRPAYVVSQVQDITARKQAEEEIRRSETRYRDLVEMQQDVIVRMDSLSRITFVNDAYCRKFGIAHADVMGKTAGEQRAVLVHADDLAETMTAIRALYRPPYRSRVDNRVRTPEGWRWISWDATAIRDASGAIVEIQSVGRDITERQHAEEALRASEERYRGLVESQQDLIARFDRGGRTTFVNDAYCQRFGKAPAELLGTSFLPLIHPDDRAARTEAMRELDIPPHRARVEMRSPTPEGWRWIAWEVCLVKDEHGQTVEYQSVGRDVTERRAGEDALRTSLEELRRSEETLRLLAQRQTAIREEERKRLGFDLHDDVCQELIGIGILVESLRRRLAPLPDGVGAEIDRIVGYLNELVEHVRVLARELRPMLLRDLGLEGSLRSLAHGMSTDETAVRAEFGGMIPRLDESTELAVFRVAQEALANALRHAVARTVVVTLAVEGGVLRLDVRDDGCGFATDLHDHGGALGLVSMQERALALRGRFEVRSSPGSGTAVHLECPVVARAAASAA